MFYILQMACDHNCTAEGSCWDLLIGIAVLRDHPALSVGAACWLLLNRVVRHCSLNLRPDLESQKGQKHPFHTLCELEFFFKFTMVYP